jgi:hypothetical protein
MARELVIFLGKIKLQFDPPAWLESFKSLASHLRPISDPSIYIAEVYEAEEGLKVLYFFRVIDLKFAVGRYKRGLSRNQIRINNRCRGIMVSKLHYLKSKTGLNVEDVL